MLCTHLSISLLFLLSVIGKKSIRPIFQRVGFYELRVVLLISSSGMGRVKLKIKRLENINGRQSTYAKRKNGIVKKANELSILCDIDIVLIMFSPSGKPTICKAKNSSIEGVIEKFAQLTPQERAKRKLESLEALKKTFKKLDHDVNIQEFIGTSYQSVEDLTNRAKLLGTQLLEVQNRLSCWTNPDNINSIEQLGHMEDSLRESLNQIRTQKENFVKQPVLSLGCTNQFQKGIHLGQEQQLQPLSWICSDTSQQMILPKDPNLFPKRDTECSASTSFGSYSGYLGTSGVKVETATNGQENGFLDELIKTDAWRLQVYAQYPYPPNNFGFPCDKKFEPPQQNNVQETTEDYCFDGTFEQPKFGYDTAIHGWASSTEPCSVALSDGHLYQQQHCTYDNRLASELGYIHEKATHQPNLTN